MTPEEIVAAEENSQAAKPLSSVIDGISTMAAPVRGKTNDALKDYQGPGFGRGSTHRTGGINSRLADPLFNAVDPDHFIKTEKAWHRRAVDLSIQGFEIKEICNLLGYGRGQVETVLKQPWAQERIIESSKKSVMEEMKEFLEAEVMPSLTLIKQIRDDVSIKAEIRSDQATKLLNRFLGKEVQPMTTVAKEEVQMTNDELAKEAKRILEQQRHQNS